MNTTDPMVRAQELWAQYKHEMTLENTPRSQVDDEAGEDEWMSEAGRSEKLEDLLAAHVRAHPDTFRDTEFAYILDSAEGAWFDPPEPTPAAFTLDPAAVAQEQDAFTWEQLQAIDADARRAHAEVQAEYARVVRRRHRRPGWAARAVHAITDAFRRERR